MIQLPEDYIRKMELQLGGQTEAFMQSYEQPRTHGLRINLLKINPQSERMTELLRLFGLRPVPWCPTGYYYEADTRPGKHPYHAAGVYYIQEPSAMSAVELLDPQPGETVLDLAAAPGGKATHIADKLQGRGLLVANEIHPARAKILSENIERMGIANSVVTSASPDQLAARFPEFFDKIMLDAPCSGEGMFRKDPDAIGEWSLEHVRGCAVRQSSILDEAARMIRQGGTIAYSTCTFSEEENERNVESFLSRHPEFSLRRIERLWPHLHEGEGHFVALLDRKDGMENVKIHGDRGPDTAGRIDGSIVRNTARVEDSIVRNTAGRDEGRIAKSTAGNTIRSTAERVEGSFAISTARANARGTTGRLVKGAAGRTEPQHKSTIQALELFRAFAAQIIPGFDLPEGEPLLFGEQLYWLPFAHAGSDPSTIAPLLHGLKVLRPGLHLATVKKDRIEPAHALAVSLQPEACEQIISLSSNGTDVLKYLKGETLTGHKASGWTLIAVDRFSLGWGKASGEQIKNHYPKGLRSLG